VALVFSMPALAEALMFDLRAPTPPLAAMPGHGTGQPMGHVTEGVVGSHPVGTNRGPGRTTMICF